MKTKIKKVEVNMGIHIRRQQKLIEFERDIYLDMDKWLNGYNKDKVLFIEGARQIGKTHVINNFVDRNFGKVVKINLMTKDKEDLEKIDSILQKERLSGKLDRNIINSNHELFKRFSKEFENNSDCVVIIDEIQEDYNIFNRIRQFAREFEAKFIVTGSYLGLTIMREEFKQSAGDTKILKMTPMSFEEFLKACNKYELYKSLDFYGKSSKSNYDAIYKYFKIYLITGGYPKSIERYLESDIVPANFEESYYIELLEVILNESQKYFNIDSIHGNLVDYTSLRSCVIGLTRLLLREKKCIEKGDYISELKRIMGDKNIKITEKSCMLSIAWLTRASLINTCCKVVDFDFDYKLFNQRFYFNDTGFSNYLLNIFNENKNNNSEIIGLIHETFIFNELNKIREPNFGLYKGGEIDFLYLDKLHSELYGIEVKAGKNTGKTIQQALTDNKVDKVLYCKGNTYGGIDNKTITIPIYLFPRYLKEILNSSNINTHNVFVE